MPESDTGPDQRIVTSASDDQLCIQDHICILHVILKQKEELFENSSLQGKMFF